MSKAFAARGHECICVDLAVPKEIPEGCRYLRLDVRSLYVHPGDNCRGEIRWRGPQIVDWIKPDFIWASPPCDEFACFGMPHFRKDPPYPKVGIELFEHTRWISFASKVPFIIENVRSAQEFVGSAAGHAGSFYLWGNAVPPILPQVFKAKWRANKHHGRRAPGNFAPELNLPKAERKAKLATIPPELANCVAEYAERLLEQRVPECAP